MILTAVTLAALPLVSLASAVPQVKRYYPVPGNGTNQTTGFSGVDWKPCTINEKDPPEKDSIQVYCGSLTVPLDYSDPKSKETLDLELVKVNAAYRDKKGSVIFNFGGPGAKGHSPLADGGETFLKLTGGEYDLIGFNPRGTGNTLPFACFDSAYKKLAFGDAVNAPDLGASDAAPGLAWEASRVLAEECYKNRNATGDLIGTAFVARDVAEIADAVDDDGLIRYWGISYGTYLGATIAALFPDRIDRMVLDGNVNPFMYRDNNEIGDAIDADKTLKKFAHDCANHPDNCTLAIGDKQNRTGDAVEAEIDRILEDIRLRPLIHGANLKDYGGLKGKIRNTLMVGTSWLPLDRLLVAYGKRNVTDVLRVEALIDGKTPNYEFEMPSDEVTGMEDALAGIRCSDTPKRESDYSKVLPKSIEHVLSNKLTGGSSEAQSMACLQWKFKAKEIYTGDFNVKTKTPLLILNSPHDAATSFQSAEVVHKAFKGSALLKHDSPGHGITGAHGSDCTAKAVRTYFEDAVLPAQPIVCSSPYHSFQLESGWDEVFKGLGYNETAEVPE